MNKKTIFNKVLITIVKELHITPHEIGLTSEHRTRGLPRPDCFLKCYDDCLRVFPQNIIDTPSAAVLCVELFNLISETRNHYGLDSENILSHKSELPFSLVSITGERNYFLSIKKDIEKIQSDYQNDKNKIADLLARLLQCSYTIANMTKGMSSSALKTVKNNNSTIKPEIDAKTLVDTNSLKKSSFGDRDKLRKGIKFGYKLAEIKWLYHEGADEARTEEIANLLQFIEADCELPTNSYSSLQQNVLAHYKELDIEYYAAICIGIYLERVGSLKTATDNEFIEYIQKIVDYNIQTISEDIPDELIPNKEEFFELVNDIARLSLPTQIEHIICFFTEENEFRKDIIATQIRNIIELLQKENISYENAKSYISFFLKENQLVANLEAVNSLKFLLNTLTNITKDEYDLRLKCNVWPVSTLWQMEDLETICMDVIEEVTKKANNRAEAINVSEVSLNMSKIFNKEKDIQIFSRVVFEFHLASDEEFNILKQQIVELEGQGNQT